MPCAVLADDQGGSDEETPPRKTRAALQHLEAARKGRAATADMSDDSSDSDDDERPATRVIEGRRRLRKRA